MALLNKVGLIDYYTHGDEYYNFLQQCDIALSCHTYDENSQDSADYTFPSKILTYMGCGLSVISTDIKCVRSSAVRGCITFVMDSKPQDFAKAIISMNRFCKFEIRSVIESLDKEFVIQLGELVNNEK